MQAELSLKVRDAIDYPLLVMALLLLVTGFCAMSSASSEYANAVFGFHLQLAVKQAMFIVIALWVALITCLVPLNVLERYGWALLALGIGLLVLVLIPGVGHEVKGASRWISFGIMSLQVSELVKLCVVIFIAGYLVRREDEVRKQWSGFLKPMFVIGLITALLLAEPDFGAAVVMTAAVMAMLFVGGVRLSQFLALGAVVIGSGVLMIFTSDYRRERLVSYTDPWADQFDSGYQLVQSLIAFGRGELTGVGFGNSIQKLAYLPDAHTDFVIAIWAEEIGAIGVILVILGFAALISYMLLIARKALQANMLFGAYVVTGIAVLMLAQVFINIGVNTGLLPTKGLTLPFFSYGGSSLIAVFSGVALVARVSYELKQQNAALATNKRKGGLKS